MAEICSNNEKRIYIYIYNEIYFFLEKYNNNAGD